MYMTFWLFPNVLPQMAQLVRLCVSDWVPSYNGCPINRLYTLSFHDVINTWNAELNAEMLVRLLGQLYNVLTKPSKQQTLS